MRLFAAPTATMHPARLISLLCATLTIVASATNAQAPPGKEGKPRTNQTQAVNIQGLSYSTAVKLGMPMPVLIRAKALSKKLSATSNHTANN